MNTFLLTVSTPYGNAFSGECVSLSLRGTEGELAILSGHAPFVTPVKEGICVLTLPDASERRARLSGGVLSVDRDGATLLSGTFAFEDAGEAKTPAREEN